MRQLGLQVLVEDDDGDVMRHRQQELHVLFTERLVMGRVVKVDGPEGFLLQQERRIHAGLDGDEPGVQRAGLVVALEDEAMGLVHHAPGEGFAHNHLALRDARNHLHAPGVGVVQHQRAALGSGDEGEDTLQDGLQHVRQPHLRRERKRHLVKACEPALEVGIRRRV